MKSNFHACLIAKRYDYRCICHRGVTWFRSIGTERNSGAKVFSFVGKIKNTGLIEVPMDSTLR